MKEVKNRIAKAIRDEIESVMNCENKSLAARLTRETMADTYEYTVEKIAEYIESEEYTLAVRTIKRLDYHTACNVISIIEIVDCTFFDAYVE